MSIRFIIIFLFATSLYAAPVQHYHETREHSHELPTEGIAHSHNNGIIGSINEGTNDLNQENPITKIQDNLLSNETEGASFICNNLPSNISSECLQTINEEKNKLKNYGIITPNLMSNCYVKGSSNSLVQEAQAYFKLQVLNAELAEVLNTYDNFAMCHWSSNNFASAKKYIDNFDLLLDMVPEIKDRGGVMGGMGRWIPADSDGHRWHISHQAVRFIENTLRTSHKDLCRGKSCENFAWKITQNGLSNDFQKSLIEKITGNPEVKSLYAKRQLLTAQRAFLLLAAKENILPQGNQWANYIGDQIYDISVQLYRLSPQLSSIESYADYSISQVQSNLSPNESIISYLHSIECRTPIVWNISKNNVSFKMSGETRKECTTEILKNAIYSLKEKIESNNADINQIDSEVTWLSKQLINPISLPKPGGKLIFVVDEVMAGLPFELLKTNNGQRLGELYNISYTPSVPLLAYLDKIPNKNYGLPYIGFSQSNFNGHLAKLDSKFISLLSSEYGGISYTEANEDDLYNKSLNSKVVHFITHAGIERGEHGLYLGGSGREDGFVTGDEISNKASIDADTILITACDSAGTNSYQQVGEAYSSLSRSFLTSGAKRVIITRWEVLEDVAQNFSKKYLQYTEKEKLPSDLALKKARDDVCSINIPKCWAAWMLLGS